MAGKGKGAFIKKIFKFIMFLLFLVILAVGGFAAGIYFQLIDSDQTQEINETLQLYKLPVVGEFFDKPPGYVEEEEENNSESEDTKGETKIETVNNATNATGGNPSALAANTNKPEAPKKSKEVKLSQKDIEKQTREREAAEKKRVSKLARIYGNMKAEEAAEALGYVDSDTVVLILQKMEEDAAGQILAKMDPGQAAQITQLLFEGTRSRITLPSERQATQNFEE